MSDTRIDFLYLNEKDMIDAGVLDAGHCVETMEEVLCLLAKGDVLMGGKNRREHGIQLVFQRNQKSQDSLLRIRVTEDLCRCRRISVDGFI